MIDAIEKNGNDISLLNGEFHRYVRSKGLVERIPFREMATTDFMRHYEYPINSWPFFVSPEMVSSMQEMNANILKMTYKAVRAIFNEDAMKMAAALNMDPVRCSFFFNGVDFSDICFRTDAILTDDGLKLVEVNVGTAIGGWQIQWMDETFRQYDGYRDFFGQHNVNCRNTPVTFFKFLIASAAKIARTGKANILVKVKRGFDPAVYGTFLQQYIARAIGESGVDCDIGFFAGFDELEVNAEGTFHRGRRVHLVTFGDLSGEPDPPLELLRSIFARKLASPDFPTYVLLSDKRNMALLHYAAQMKLLSPHEAALVERYVPKTYILGGPLFSPAVRDELLANRERYVVKQCNGMQGIDVHVGRFMSDQEWRNTIWNLRQPELWIAQAYCESKQFYGHADASCDVFNFVWGVFQFGEKFGGSWIRMMREKGKYDGVINSARGAEERIVFEAAC
ncbi:hypothetical protein [Tahibacter amnicola]|uniref:Circularly permuted ATP-grasp superfamily protein n=1 Tax=Tahibacter amnicola TaxID=2976241 RepID=A0ABY6BAN3_9GAMM|nr:hypothetical protein [Tahibacter amnicola]UXI66208.1 hypothetical protein N4264_15785 [Tahibacter amnicola]